MRKLQWVRKRVNWDVTQNLYTLIQSAIHNQKQHVGIYNIHKYETVVCGGYVATQHNFGSEGRVYTTGQR